MDFDNQSMTLEEAITIIREIDPDPKPMSNADRIRGMTDEELAEWLFHAWHKSWYTLQEWNDWLKSPVEVDE